MSNWVQCGRIGRAIGLKGECAVFWASGRCPVDVGGELFLVAADGATRTAYRVASLRSQGRGAVVRFEGVGDRTAAESIRGAAVELPAAKLPALPAGEYYCYQILGLLVVTEEGRELGTIVRIFTAGENDVYEVRPDGGSRGAEILIPAIAEVVLAVDLAAKRVTVRPLEGMLD
jgi:16S rRNA processing protein RimM